MRAALALVSLFLLTAAAEAAATPWQEVAPGVRLRLISADTVSSGKLLAGVELDMPPATKTYWRVPGETGIPMEIDLSASRGLDGPPAVRWPFPSIDTATGFVDFVYFGPTVLPLEVGVEGSSAQLEAALTLGICSDICVPVSARFSLPLSFDKPDAAQLLRLRQALADTPLEWTDPAPPIGDIAYDPAANALQVQLDAARLDPATLIADAGLEGQLFGAPQKSPDKSLVLVPLLGSSDDGGSVEGTTVKLTFMTAQGPYWLTRRVAHAGSTAGGQ